MLDGGRDHHGGNPPATVAWDGRQVPNFRRDEAPGDAARRRAEGMVEGADGRLGGGDLGAMYRDRAVRYDFVQERGIDGFVIVSGDRHSFPAGYAAPTLPPKGFDPVGVAFVAGSLHAVGLAEVLEHGLEDHRLRPLFTAERPDGRREATPCCSGTACAPRSNMPARATAPPRWRCAIRTTRRTSTSAAWAGTATRW